jgi:uncharacterized repeat protein (TIGR01451 family)
MRGFGRLAALSASAALIILSVGAPAPAVAAPGIVTVRVTIEKVDAIDCFEGTTVFGCSGEADFYSVVTIDGAEFPQSETIDDENNADPNPDWVFERQIDIARGTIPVSIQIYDEDGGLRFNDDQADVSPVQGGDDLNLDIAVRLAPVCAVSGDVTLAPEECGHQVATDGDADEERARLFWRIEVIDQDADGDWLPDSWETSGLDSDGDGTIDVDLPAMGADPMRKDLFLEIDCLVAAGSHSHCPMEEAVRTVVQSLADAPVSNPDGSFGVQLHVDVGDLYGQALGTDTEVPRADGGAVGSYGNHGGGADRIPEAGNEIVDWDGMEGDPATKFYALKSAYFDPDRALAFRYAISVHQVNARHPVNDCTGGWAEGGGVDADGNPVAANDFIVSLGGLNDVGDPCWGTDAGGSSVGTWDQQAGVILHELGHTLGLGHGGGDSVNRKPNYLSVMNYAFGGCGVPSIPGVLRGGCDFSRIALPTLEEVLPPGLDECAGIGLGLGPVDWDAMDGLTGTTCSPASGNVSVNVNGDFEDPNGNEIQDPGEDFIFGSLVGYEDWGRLAFGFRGTQYFANGSAPPPPDPMDPEAIAAARAFLSDLMRPTLAVDKTGPADALPGDTLSYSIDLANAGRGPALETVLGDTLPDGTNGLSSTVGTLPVGATAHGAASYTIPCSAGDGSVLTNTALATGLDLVGNAVSGTDVIQTTVHAPVLAATKTATASVGAGEAITYRLTYANTGSSSATSVTVTDTLPTGVYYSVELDVGGGPRPDSVTPNADGTTTLRWNVGDVPGSSGDRTIEFTARPTLLALPGTTFTNSASVTFSNANGCTYAPVTATAPTVISVVHQSRDPKSIGFWKTHPEQWTPESLARIQATDQRYDGADGSAPDGILAASEMSATLKGTGGFPEMLQRQLLGVYSNLATRRIEAGTVIGSKTADKLGTANVRDAALNARSTLLLPVTSATSDRYSDSNKLLDEINNNKSEEY